MADIKAIAEALVNISSKEVEELAKTLKDEYGITAAANERKPAYKQFTGRMNFRKTIPVRKRHK